MWKQGDLMTSSHINYGILLVVSVSFVLITFYVTATAFARNLEFYINEGYKSYWNMAEDATAGELPLTGAAENRFIAHENSCSDFEMFTQPPQKIPAETPVETKHKDKDSANGRKVGSGRGAVNQTKNKQHSKRNGSGSGSGSGNGNKSGKNNKTVKKSATVATANAKAQTQQQAAQKKSSATAEPIIYLFALVFIYLLLKAASDINQHYKSQTKDGKRLRRCSLQSYAQTQTAQKQQERRLMAKTAQKNSPKL